MKWLRAKSPLPLLGKELMEQAARKRTYVLRTLYAAIAFTVFCLVFHGELRRAQRDPLRVLGYGGELFSLIVTIQFVGIFLLLPAIMCGVLTHEKEHQTLSLLFLTDLGPWEIVLEKFLGRLVPMLTFLLLSLPLLAICQAFGGVSVDYLCSGILLLFLTCLQVGAFSLMFSSFARTTVAAFLCSYLVGAAFYLGFPLCCAWLDMAGVIDMAEDVAFAFLGPYIFYEASRAPFHKIVLRSIPIVASTGVFLLMARYFLVRRAFVPHRNPLLQTLKRLDRFWTKANKIVGGIVLIKESDTLPEDKPIAWRETTRKSLGRLSYLLRIVLLIQIPLVAVCVWSATLSRSFLAQSEDVSALVFILWGIAALVVCVKSAYAIVSERVAQTLDPLLCTPLTGREILRQKMQGIYLVIIVLLIPFLTLFMAEAQSEHGSWWPSRHSPELGGFVYVICSMLTVVVYLPMVAWVSYWIGLRPRARSRAIITAVVAIAAWCVLPLLFLVLLDANAGIRVDRPPLSFLFLLSPASLVVLTELDALDELFDGPWSIPVFVNLLWHALILCYFRFLCLRNADRYLGRATAGGGKQAPAPPAEAEASLAEG